MKVWNSDTDTESLVSHLPFSFRSWSTSSIGNADTGSWKILNKHSTQKCVHNLEAVLANGMICMISKYLVIYDETGSPVVHINGAVATSPTLVAQTPPDWPLEKALATWKIKNYWSRSAKFLKLKSDKKRPSQMSLSIELFVMLCDKSCNLERVAPHQPASCPQIPKADNKWRRPKNVR